MRRLMGFESPQGAFSHPGIGYAGLSSVWQLGGGSGLRRGGETRRRASLRRWRAAKRMIMMADVHDKATRSKICGRSPRAIRRLKADSGAADRGGIHLCRPGSRCRDVPISLYPTTAALSLLTAVSGITMTAICLRCRPPARHSGWTKSPVTWRATPATGKSWPKRAGGY